MHKIYDELDLSVLAEFPKEMQEEILLSNDTISAHHQSDERSKTTKRTLARKLENDFEELDNDQKIKIHQKALSTVCILELNIFQSKLNF